MLPLHGQDTAAVKVYHWAGSTSNISFARGDVFGKQARFYLLSSFFVFLSFVVASLCGVNESVFNVFLVYYWCLFPFTGSVIISD